MHARYAIVLSHGRYQSSDRVRAAAVLGNRDAAVRRAEHMTREFQAGMRPYGGTSGGFRVVQTDATSRRTAVWFGHDLDNEPTA